MITVTEYGYQDAAVCWVCHDQPVRDNPTARGVRPIDRANPSDDAS